MYQWRRLVYVVFVVDSKINKSEYICTFFYTLVHFGI